jgi:NAD(P)H dehydrogenase (quinone)
VRVFILYANPVATSFGAALHMQVVATLRARGHEIDDCDLYVESFDPIMNEQERVEYHDTTINKPRVAAFADRLLAADALVLVYPVSNEGFLPRLSKLRARQRLARGTSSWMAETRLAYW